MFGQGARPSSRRTWRRETTPTTTRPRCRTGCRLFVEFCTDDVPRYQLLFQHTIPGFAPSAASYAPAVPRARRHPGGTGSPRDHRTPPSRHVDRVDHRARGSADLERPGRRPLGGPDRRFRLHVHQSLSYGSSISGPVNRRGPERKERNDDHQDRRDRRRIYRLSTLRARDRPDAGSRSTSSWSTTTSRSCSTPGTGRCSRSCREAMAHGHAGRAAALDRASATSSPTSAAAMNEWLAAAPERQVAHGAIGCMVSLNDMADRPPRPLADGEVIDLGGKRVRHIDTPHVPHGWEARVLFEETTGTLLVRRPLHPRRRRPGAHRRRHRRRRPARPRTCSASTAPRAPTRRRRSGGWPTSRRRTLALMHGSSFTGDCAAALHALADDYRDRITTAGLSRRHEHSAMSRR